MMVFGRVIFPSFNDREFEECYAENGRPAISPAFLACVTMLQFRENLSDAETAKAVVRRLDWKIALHLPIWQNVSFDPSTLTYFRRRLKENGKMWRLFDKTIDLAQRHGFLRQHTNQRIDATHIVAHMNRISTTDLLFRTVRCVVEEFKKREPEVYRNEAPEHLNDRYTNDFSSFGMSKKKRHDRLAEIIEDGLGLQSIITKHFGEHADEFKQLKIMETIFEENMEIKKNFRRCRSSRGGRNPAAEAVDLRSARSESPDGKEGKVLLGWEQMPLGRDCPSRANQFHHQHDLSGSQRPRREYSR